MLDHISEFGWIEKGADQNLKSGGVSGLAILRMAAGWPLSAIWGAFGL